MSHPGIITILLSLAILTAIVTLLGMIFIPGAFNKLHYLGATSVFGSLFVAAALTPADAPVQSKMKAWLTLLALLVSSPVLTHLIARAIRRRRKGELDFTATEERAG